MDIFNHFSIKSQIIVESGLKIPNQLDISVIKPRDYEDNSNVKTAFSKLYESGIVTRFVESPIFSLY